jgi:hypothetical protein
MKVEVVVAIIAGACAILSAGISVWSQRKSARLAADLQDARAAEDRRLEREKSMSRYKEPFARAAYDLQSRLYNILAQRFLVMYYTNGNDRERAYALNNTVFLVAQYFGWTEIIRREIQFLDLGTNAATREFSQLQDRIFSIWASNKFDPVFRVFAGEQRAIGERMICENARGAECIGYGAFLKVMEAAADPLLNALREDVRETAQHPGIGPERMLQLQHAMIDLLSFLDPEYLRFGKETRTKVVLQTAGPQQSAIGA